MTTRNKNYFWTEPTRVPRADRKRLCKKHGLTYSGRQWRKLRKFLANPIIHSIHPKNA